MPGPNGHRCESLTALGEPCKQFARPGHTTCFQHGGFSQGSQIKARLQLALLAAPAIETLFQIIEQHQRDTCLACGYPKHDSDEKKLVAQIAVKILDRTGFGPSATLNLTTQTDGDLNLDLLTRQEHTELYAAAQTMVRIKQALRQRQLVGTNSLPDIDGELVPDEPAALPAAKEQ